MLQEIRHAVNQNVATNKLNPISLRKARIVCNFGLSDCNLVTAVSHNTAASGHSVYIYLDSNLKMVMNETLCASGHKACCQSECCGK